MTQNYSIIEGKKNCSMRLKHFQNAEKLALQRIITNV